MPLSRLNPQEEERFIALPESGMGYQVVRYRGKMFVVFNAVSAIEFEELGARAFTREEVSILAGETSPESTRVRFDGEVEILEQFSLYSASDYFGYISTRAFVFPLSLAGVRQPRAFYRYSAYSKDRRVTRKGDFVPGTYATTYSDMHFVPSGFAAVGRYALPNPASARFLTTIVTNEPPSLMGAAAPNFGQAGGGVEVFFSGGATNIPDASVDIGSG